MQNCCAGARPSKSYPERDYCTEAGPSKSCLGRDVCMEVRPSKSSPGRDFCRDVRRSKSSLGRDFFQGGQTKQELSRTRLLHGGQTKQEQSQTRCVSQGRAPSVIVLQTLISHKQGRAPRLSRSMLNRCRRRTGASFCSSVHTQLQAWANCATKRTWSRFKRRGSLCRSPGLRDPPHSGPQDEPHSR